MLWNRLTELSKWIRKIRNLLDTALYNLFAPWNTKIVRGSMALALAMVLADLYFQCSAALAGIERNHVVASGGGGSGGRGGSDDGAHREEE